MKLTERSSLTTVALCVGDVLRRKGVRAVLTGGACASLHTRGAYQSADVDFVLSGRVTRMQLDAAMATVEFERIGDHYVHPRARFFVEFPNGPLAIGSDYSIRPIEYAIRGTRALVLSPTDSCRDRLAAFFHWNDRQSLAVALTIARRNRVNLALLRRWSAGDGHENRFDEFLTELKRARARLKKADREV